jgi:hypothetical protein
MAPPSITMLDALMLQVLLGERLHAARAIVEGNRLQRGEAAAAIRAGKNHIRPESAVSVDLITPIAHLEMEPPFAGHRDIKGLTAALLIANGASPYDRCFNWKPREGISACDLSDNPPLIERSSGHLQPIHAIGNIERDVAVGMASPSR